MKVVIILLLAGAIAAAVGLPEVRNISGRIVGGSVADPGQFLYQASLRTIPTVQGQLGVHFCGGWIHTNVVNNMLNNRWIITTASCVRDRTANTVRVHVGTQSQAAIGVPYEVLRIIIHDDYDAGIIANNIALIQTTQAIANVPGQVQSIDFVDATIGEAVRVAGWGQRQHPGDNSERLKWLSVETIARDECLAGHTVISQRFINNDTICTRAPVGHGMCMGDGGSPLVFTDANNIGHVIGIVSWGRPCGLGAPDVNVRVNSYNTWIRNVVATTPQT